MRREIFTLLHEFAHYLISYEEIDEINDAPITLKIIIQITQRC